MLLRAVKHYYRRKIVSNSPWNCLLMLEKEGVDRSSSAMLTTYGSCAVALAIADRVEVDAAAIWLVGEV